jgi:hypothetical protein
VLIIVIVALRGREVDAESWKGNMTAGFVISGCGIGDDTKEILKRFV